MEKIIRTYTELMRIPSYEGRFEYLRIGNKVGEETFGSKRYLNQILYRIPEWRKARSEVILRDEGYDLGFKDLGYEIIGSIYVHHMNPITIEDIINKSSKVFDTEYLISTSFNTHEGIHYSNTKLLDKKYTERKPNDTCPWR